MTNIYNIYIEWELAIIKFNSVFQIFEDVLELIRDINNCKNINIVSKVLVDLRGSSFNIKLSEIEKLNKSDYKKILAQEPLKIICLVDTPKETALSQIFFLKINHASTICSTVEYAYQALSLPFSICQFKELLKI